MRTTRALRTAPDVHVEAAEQAVDVRAWARFYVRTLLELEGVIPAPTALPRAS